MEQKKYKTLETVESLRTMFGTGLAKNKEGKIIFLRQVQNEDGTPNKARTLVFVNLYLTGDEERNEETNFINFAISLERAGLIKEVGIDLGKKLSTPIKVRYTIAVTEKDGRTNVLRTITNVCRKVDGNWEWVFKPKSQEKADEKAEFIDIDDDDLPF